MQFNFTANKRKKWLMLFVSAIMMISLLAACGKDELDPAIEFSGVDGGEQVASYKDGSVTDKEFNKFKSALSFTQGIEPAIFDMAGYREYMLEQFIVYKVLAARASEEQQNEAKEEALSNIEQMVEQYKSYGNGDIEEQLKEYDLTRNDLASFLMMGGAVSKYIDSQITDDMLKTEYEENKADYTLYDIRQIVINLSVQDPTTGEATVTRTEEEALARAQEVKQKLEAGGSWEELAKEYSDDATTKETGGVYTDFMGGRWYEPVKEAVYTQDLNKIGEPILTALGYHVIMVEGRDVLEFDALADATKEMIRYVLSNEVMNKFMTEEIPALEINMTLPPLEGQESTDAEAGSEDATNTDAGDDAANAEQGTEDTAGEATDAPANE